MSKEELSRGRALSIVIPSRREPLEEEDTVKGFSPENNLVLLLGLVTGGRALGRGEGILSLGTSLRGKKGERLIGVSAFERGKNTNLI